MNQPIAVYEYAKLVEHADILAGPPFNSGAFTDKPEDIPLIKGENVQQGYVDWTIAKRWPAHDADSYKRYVLVPGDVVVAMDRPWVTAGLKWAYIKQNDPPALLVQRVARLRGKKTLDQSFLRCLISSEYFSNYIQPIVTGVNVPHISGKQIGDFKIPVLPLETQQKIAAILSAYDDLIANNQRRITLLERMAEDIYREWFVRLRFPGHENVKVEKGVPQGWLMSEIGDVCSTLKRGIAPNYTESKTTLVINQRCIRDGFVNLAEARGHDTKVSDEKLLQYGDVLINSTGVGTLGRVAVFDHELTNATCDTHVTICRANQKAATIHYLGQAIRSLQEHFESMAVGSTGQSELGRDAIGRTMILLPPLLLQKSFADSVEPVLRRKRLLRRQTKVLATTRDALLPRLISGKLAVDALDIRFPPGMTPRQQKISDAMPPHA